MSAEAELVGLGGHSADHEQILLYVTIGVFATIVLILVFLYRRSRDSLEMEEIDALLRQEDVL